MIDRRPGIRAHDPVIGPPFRIRIEDELRHLMLMTGKIRTLMKLQHQLADLAVAEHDGFFSDNYFNLAPGRQMTVEFHSRTPLTLKEFQERLQIRSMFDAFH